MKRQFRITHSKTFSPATVHGLADPVAAFGSSTLASVQRCMVAGMPDDVAVEYRVTVEVTVDREVPDGE